MLKEYIAYLKDNPKGYWFKAKLYGWGWTPATWQGWLVLAVFLALITLNFFRTDSTQNSISDFLISFVPQTAILVLALIGICYLTGEKPKWQWGLNKQEKND
ncbi:MAG: hypothetical protein ABI430_00730 [Candidatus Taylorbacteria bacterium]